MIVRPELGQPSKVLEPVDVRDLEDPWARKKHHVFPVDTDDAHLLRVEVQRATSQLLDLSDDRDATPKDHGVGDLGGGVGGRDGPRGQPKPDAHGGAPDGVAAQVAHRAVDSAKE